MGAISKVKMMLDYLKPTNLAKNHCLDLAGNDVVFVSGSGRSGTSWLANICNYQNDFRYLFEPLNPAQLQQSEHIQWCLPRDAIYLKNEPLVLKNALEGRVSNKWVNSRNRKLFAKRRLVKEIRSNCMLPWVNANYPNAKLVFITRNPLAVAASRKSLNSRKGNSNWLWQPDLPTLLKEPVLQEQLSKAQLELLSSQIGKGVVLETVADWCINNLVSLAAIKQTDFFHVYYESLVSDGNSLCKELMAHIGVDYDSSIDQALNKQSETSRSEEARHWNVVLTESEIGSAIELLNEFGIERLYTKDWQPATRDK